MANQSTTSLKLSDCTNVFHNRSIMGKNGNLTPNLSIENATVLSDNSAVSESQVLNNKSFVERVRQVSNLSGLSLFFPKGSLNDTKLKMKSKKCSDNSLSLTQVLQKLEESSDVTPPPELKNNKGCKVSITFEKSSKDKEEDSLQISDQLDEISTRFEKSERRKKPKANKVSINFDCRSQTPSISNDSLTMPSIGNSANVSERTRRSTRNKSSVSINYDVSSQTLETSNESKVVSDKEKSINARTRKSSRKKHSLLNGITEKEANVPVNVEKITKEVLEEQSNEPLSEKTEGFGENIKGAASNDGSHMEASTEELMTTERVAVDGTEKPESQTEMEVDNPQNKDDSCKDNNNLSVSEEIKGVDVRSQNEVGISNSEENNPAMPNSLTDSSPSKDTEEQMGKANQENNIILGSNGPEGQVIPSESPKENLSQNTIVAKKIKDALKKSSRIPKLKRLQSKKFISGNSQKVENTREKSEVNCNKTDLIKDIKEQDCITSETKTNTQEIPLETESLAENNSGGNDISQKDSIDSLVSGSELSLKRYSTQVESKSKIRQHCSVHVNVYFESTKSITTTSFTVPSKTSSECSPVENNACRSGSAEDNKSDEDHTINSLPTGSELSLNGNSTAAGSKLKRVKQHCSVHVDFESTNGLTTTSLTMTPKPILQESADDTAEKSECVIGSALKAPTNDGEIEKEINGSLLSGSKLSEPEKSTGTESKAIAENSDCRKDSLVKRTVECREASKEVPVLDSTSMAPCADSADTPNINKLSENKTETKVGKILNSTYNVDSQIHTPLGGSEENQTTQNKELVLPLNPANKLDLPPSAIQASDKSDTFALVKPTDECKEDGQTVKTLPVLDSTSMAPCADSAKTPSINKLSENKIETNFGKILNSTYTVDSQIHTPFGESDENQNKELVLPLNPPMLGLPSSTIQASDVSDTYGDQNRNQDREFGVLRRDSHCGEITINETPMENVFDARGSNAHFAVSRPGRVSEFDLSMTMGVSVISSEPGVNQGGGKGHSTPISQFSLSNEQQDQSKEEMNESENVVFAHPHPPLRRSLRASLGKRSLGQSDIENVSKRRKLDKTGIETTVGTFLNMRDVPQSTPKPEHDEDSQSTTRSTRRSSLAMENKKNQVIQVSKSIFGSSTDSSSRTYSKKRRTNDLPPISSPKEPPGKKVNKSPQFIQLKKTSTKSVCFMDIPSYSLSQSSRKSSPYSLRGNNSRMHISRKVSSTSRVQSWSSSSTEGSNVTSERGSRYKQHTVHFRNYSSHIDFSETDLSGGMTQSSKENSKVPSLVGNDSNPKNQSDSEEDLSSQNQSNKGDLLRQKRFQPRKTEIKNSENSIQQEPASEYRSEIGESISRIETVAERSAQYEASGLNTSVPSSDYSISTTILDPMNILTGRQEEAKGMKQRPMITLPLNLRSVKGKKEKFDYKNNPAFMINGQPYEPPKSKLFEKWVHPKMLMFITSQLQKHYLNHDCILLDRRIVGYVCSTVSAVSKLQQDSDIATATIVLRNILSHYKICSNVLEYYLFIRSYTPFDFQRKALSLKGFIKDKKLGDPLVSENEKLNIDLLDQND